MAMKLIKTPATVCMLTVLVSVAWTQTAPNQPKRGYPRIGSPDSVENLLEDDGQIQPFNLRDGLRDDHGLSFSLDYSAVGFAASESPGDSSAASGMLRFYGSWDLAGKGTKDTGAFIWKVEHRHAYTDVPASGFSFELGNIGLFEAPFSDQGARMTNLYWRQRFGDGRFTLMAGMLDSTDAVDVFAMGSPWMHFMNFAFSTGTTTMTLPNDAALGIMGGAMLGDQVYVLAGLTDMNSDPTDPFETFSTFFDQSEFYTFVEVGLTPSQDRIYFDNMHLTLWHTDARDTPELGSGWGLNFSYVRFLGESWMPFLRAGYSDSPDSLMSKSISAGVGYYFSKSKNLLGLGFNWGDPNEESFGSGLSNQYTVETFYRFWVTDTFAVTPDVQLLVNPALNPDASTTWVFGLRGRVTF